VSLVPAGFEKTCRKGLQARFDALPPENAEFSVPRGIHKALTKKPTRLWDQPAFAQARSTEALAGSFRDYCCGAFSEPQTCNFSTISEFLLLTDTG